MKNNGNNSEFDIEKLIQERQLVDREITDELNYYPTSRIEGLLLTNYVENILKDCIVCLVKSKSARKISRQIINEILLDRKVIDSWMFEDVKKIFQIRDQYGHTMKLSVIDETIKPIMMKLTIASRLKKTLPEWDELPLDDKLSRITDSLILNLQICFENLLEGQGYHLQKKEEQYDGKDG